MQTKRTSFNLPSQPSPQKRYTTVKEKQTEEIRSADKIAENSAKPQLLELNNSLLCKLKLNPEVTMIIYKFEFIQQEGQNKYIMRKGETGKYVKKISLAEFVTSHNNILY